MAKNKRLTRERLEALVTELRAATLYNLKAAHAELNRCGCDRLTASGVIITITNLDGSVRVPPFMCQDGLEAETITALKKQIKKTHTLAVAYGIAED